jgi:tetratricopeptide (TPR) repeat protein
MHRHFTERLDWLEAPQSGFTPDRQRSLRATLTWSWDLLTNTERNGLRRLSLFANTFSVQLAVAVLDGLDSPLEVLQGLVDHSLVHRERPQADSSQQLRLSRAMRDFADGRWTDDDALPAREALQARFARILCQNFKDSGHSQTTALTVRPCVLEDLVRGARQSLDPEAAATCCRIAVEILRWRGPLSQADELLQEALRGPIQAPIKRAQLMLLRAITLRSMGELEHAGRLAEEAHTQLRSLGELGEAANALGCLGLTLLGRGRRTEARDALEHALELKQSASSRDCGTLLANLGYLERLDGHFDVAQALYERAQHAFLVEGDRIGEGSVLDKLCNLKWGVGDLARSRWYGERALEIHREVGNRNFEAIALGNLGTLHLRAGEEKDARARFEAARELHATLGNREGLCISTVYLAGLCRAQGDWATGRALLGKARKIAYQLGAPPLWVRTLTEWATLELQAGEPTAAYDLSTAALTHMKETEPNEAEVQVRAIIGLAEQQLGRPEMAREHLRHGRRAVRILGLQPESQAWMLLDQLTAALDGDAAGPAEP